MIAVLFVFWPPIVSWIVSTIFGLKSSYGGNQRIIKFILFSVIFGLAASFLQGGITGILGSFDGGKVSLPPFQDYLRLALIFSALNFPFMYLGVFLKQLKSLRK